MDSGASVSVISKDLCKMVEFKTGSKNVMGIGGSQVLADPVPCTFRLGKHDFANYLLRPIELPEKKKTVILGRDFMRQFKTTKFDWANNRILLDDEWIFLMSDDAPAKKQYTLNEDLNNKQKTEIEKLVESNRDSFAVNNKAPQKCTLGLHIIQSQEEGLYHRDKVRRLPLNQIDYVNQQVKEMLDNGIIHPSKSPYNNNILLTDKDDGSKRFVLDFRNLNKNTKPDNYPMPNVEQMIESTYGLKFFTQLDLASGYWAVPLRKEDQEKTAFSAPNGKYEFAVLPYGLLNAMATFQRFMDKLVAECRRRGVNNIDAYVDNIMLGSYTYEEHMAALRIIFQVLREYKMTLREDKCEFLKSEIRFLGFVIDGKKIRPDPKNVEKMRNFPAPKTKKEVQRFLGLANFNRKFFEGLAEVAKPLTDLTSAKVPFRWTEKEDAAFKEIRSRVTEQSELYIPDWNDQFYINVDASDFAMGAVLYQRDKSKEAHPIAYASKSFAKSQLNWSATEKELFGVIWTTRKWDVYCTRKPIIRSDHLSLLNIRKQKDPRRKLARWITELENVNCTLQFLKGEENIEADCLSRVLYGDDSEEYEGNRDCVYNISADNEYPTLEVIKKHQRACPELRRVMKCIEDKTQIEVGPYKNYNNMSIEDGLLSKGLRVIVPDALQEVIIKELHGQHHYGAPNTLELCKNRFYWRGMKQQVFKLINTCETCLQCKVAKPLKAELVTPKIPPPRARLAIDIGSMPITMKGNNSFLMMVDANTKFIAVKAMKGQKAGKIKKALWEKWIPYFGIPEEGIISDQGKNVDGKKIRKLCSDLNIKKIRSSPYHPEGNGSAEKAIGTVKTLLRSMTHSRGLHRMDWDQILPEAVLAANNMTNKSSEYSPFETMWGSRPRLPVDSFMENLSSNKDREIEPHVIQKNADLNRYEAQLNYKKRYDKDAVPVEYTVGQEVLLKRNHGDYPKASVRWLKGPYYISKKVGPVNYGITGPDGFTRLLHHNGIRAARSSIEATKTPDLVLEEESQPEAHQFRVTIEHHLARQEPQSITNPIQQPRTPTTPVHQVPSTPPNQPISTPHQPLTTPLRLPFGRGIDQQAFTEKVFSVPLFDTDLIPNGDRSEDSFVEEQEDNVLVDRDWEAPNVDLENLDISSRRMTRSMRNNLNDPGNFESIP